MREEILAAFPQLRPALDAAGQRFVAEGRALRLDPGQFVCMQGQGCSHLALVLDGTVRVYKSGESGREITLYRVERGESCILTASCILNERPFPAYAVTETQVAACMIPASTFQRWVEAYREWQQYVFDLMARRLEAVIEVVEEVAFRRLDARLADYLLGEAGDEPQDAVIHATHEAIAAELGSSREVVSRLLKDFEREGLVGLSRGAVTVADPGGLGRRSVRE